MRGPTERAKPFFPSRAMAEEPSLSGVNSDQRCLSLSLSGTVWAYNTANSVLSLVPFNIQMRQEFCLFAFSLSKGSPPPSREWDFKANDIRTEREKSLIFIWWHKVTITHLKSHEEVFGHHWASVDSYTAQAKATGHFFQLIDSNFVGRGG